MRGDAEASRKLGYAVAASIAVHALALFGVWPALRESLQEPAVLPPLVTRLVELPKAEEVAPAPPIEEKKAAARPRETRKAEPPRPSPASPLETAREPTPPAPPSPQPEPATATAQTSAPPQPQADSRAAEAATAAQYRMQLIAYAQRNKPPYPRLARENNWVGEVTLEIALRADGQAELGLRRASGHEALDKLALDTYQQALRAVPVPPALRGRPVRLEPLRVIYNLTE